MRSSRRHGLRGIFWRIFALSWLAMTIVGVGFSLYVAASYPTERMERRAQRFVSSLGLQGRALLELRDKRGASAVEGELSAFAQDLGMRIWLIADGQVMHGSHPATPDTLALAARATTSGFRDRGGDLEQIAVALEDTPDGRAWVIAVQNPRPSPLSRALEREAQRLVLIVVVAGLFSLLLARAIARPIRRLRDATEKIAEGDLSVRVMPELGRSSAELAELASDFDRMAERLERLIESQRTLLRDVSHELRSPLARLQVALELARQRAGEGAQGALDRIERDALRLGGLISEILHLSRLDAGVLHTPDGRLEPLDLSALLDEVVSDVDFEAQGFGKRVRATVPRDVSVLGDVELIRRALENVTRNALRFSPEGGVVEVELVRRARPRESRGEEPAHEAVVTVRDHGPGVPDSHLTDIFRPFFRVESARDRDTGGAGLGLAIVERSARALGGSVKAENADGGGLRVHFALPAQ